MKTTFTDSENITPQVRVAHRRKLIIRVKPTQIKDTKLNDHTIPILYVPLGKLTGAMPIYETGIGIFEGTKEEFIKLPPHEQKNISRNLISFLTTENGVPVRVINIDGDIAYLSRKQALATIQRNTLRDLNVKSIQEAKGKILDATVVSMNRDKAICTVGGFKAVLPRREIDYTNPRPSRVLKPGETLRVKIIKTSDEYVAISHKALLPDPWADLNYKPGIIARAQVLGPTKAGTSYIVAFAPGVTGVARCPIPSFIPKRFESVAVEIKHIDHKKRTVIGRIIL